MHRLPAYCPPSAQRASVAGGVAPLVTLLVFTVLMLRLIDLQVALAWFAGCVVWVVYELHDYQSRLDAYNLDYVHRHLAWRSSDTLRKLADDVALGPDTREFVQRFLSADRVVLRDGPSV